MFSSSPYDIEISTVLVHEGRPLGIGLAIYLVLLWRKPKLEEKKPSTLVRVELHSLGLGVSISSLIALVSVEWHSLGLSS